MWERNWKKSQHLFYSKNKKQQQEKEKKKKWEQGGGGRGRGQGGGAEGLQGLRTFHVLRRSQGDCVCGRVDG